MRGAKRKRTKHYPFHRSSPSRLPRPSSSHSLSLSLARGRSLQPQLILPISCGCGSSSLSLPVQRRAPAALAHASLSLPPPRRQISAAAAHSPHLRRPRLVLPISRRSSSSPSWDAGARCWRPGAALRRRRGGSLSPARAEAGRRRAADLDAAWGSQPVGLGHIESTGPKRFRS